MLSLQIFFISFSRLNSLLEILRGSNDSGSLTEMPTVGFLNKIHSGIMEVRVRNILDLL